jgi:pimeloyl-ACP methyl ester carboxylesterase
MTGVRTTYPTYAGYRTRALTVEGEGPRLVLLHGFADSAETWSGLLLELAAQGRAAVAVDFPGFGKADLLEEGPVLTQLDRFVAALVEEQSTLGDVLLVGNSMGACVSLRAAAQGVPCAGVVSIGEPTYVDSWLSRQVRAPKASLWLRAMATPLPVPPQVSGRFYALAVRRMLYESAGHADPAVAKRFAQFFASQGGRMWLIQTTRRLSRELTTDAFDGIGCPVLVAHGARDRVIPVHTATRLHEAIPGSQLVIEPRWGHCPQLDDPAGVAAMLTEFAARPGSPRRARGPSGENPGQRAGTA